MSTKDTKVIISGDASGFQRAAAAAGTASKRLGVELGALQSIAAKGLGLAGLGGGAAVAGLVTMAKSAANTGDELYKMSQKTGISVEELSKLRYAAEMSGVENEVLGKSMTKLAGSISEAASGAGPAAERFKKLGIDVRNTDGTLRGSTEVLADLADRFSEMPDGVEKTRLAVDIFGEKIGANLIPMLNGGRAGLKAMGDEAERLGIVMSTEFAKKAEEFNDNWARMKKLSEAAGISIGSVLVPAVNKLLTEFLDARESGMGFVRALSAVGQHKGAEENLKRINAELEKMRGDRAAGKWGFFRNIDDDIKKLEQAREFYQKQLKREEGDGIKSAEMLAAERLKIAAELSGKLIELEKLRGIATGKVSADILKDDKTRTDEQIKSAEKLRDALKSAWQSSVDEAKKAGDAAEKLLQKAADIREDASDRAKSKRKSIQQPPSEQSGLSGYSRASGDDFETAQSNAEFYATNAAFAAMHGRSETAAELAEKAAKHAERAARLAEQMDDPEASASAIERNGETRARIAEAQSKVQKNEQTDLEQRAAAQQQMIGQLDQQIADLTAKAAGIKLQADISNAEGAIATLMAKLDALQQKAASIKVGGGAGSESAPAESGAAGSFATGGYTGPGGKWQPAGIVHAGEFVLRQEVVRQRGALAFLQQFNRVGLAALRGYATGGLVQPAVRSGGGGASAVFNFPGMGSFPVQMAPNVLGEMKTAFSREAMKRGSRR